MNLICHTAASRKYEQPHAARHGEGIPIRNNIPSLSLKNTLCDVWRAEKYGDLRNEFTSSVSSVCEEFLAKQLNPGSAKLARKSYRCLLPTSRN